MKRWISLLLGLTMAASMTLPAFAAPEIAVEEPLPVAPASAADAADARLKNVTELVKGTLDLDTDDYTEFSGNLSEEELGAVWNLNWSGNDKSLTVEALDDGTVLAYWYNDNQENYRYNPYLPVFPKLDAQSAKAAARAFLDRVLDASVETVELEDPATAGQLGGTNANFSGNILLNGLPSPLSYYINVRGSDNAVVSFRRDAASRRYLDGVPSATPAVTVEDAAAKLKDTLELDLIYVTANAERPDETRRAVLRYVHAGYDTKYVDAQTGELTGADDLIYYGDRGGVTMEAAMDMEDNASGSAVARKSLNATELTGVDKLKDVLSTDQLDAKIREESAYRLEDYRVATTNYQLVKEADKTENIYCTIRYTTGESAGASAKVVANVRSDRIFYVNARTGEVKSLYSYGRWNEDRKPVIKLSKAQSIAEGFLSRYTSRADALPLYEIDDQTDEGAPSYSFTFTRKVNGYYYPENNCVVSVDCDTGAVCGLSFTWDETVEFESATNLISADAALDAWMDTYETVLAYRSKSRKLDPLSGGDTEARLVSLGYERFLVLFLSYGLEREDPCPGIDAKTGKPVKPEATDYEIRYSDIDGTEYADDIQKLADYSVGYTGGAFRPNISLTQWDAVCLIASARGWRLNPDEATDEEKNSAYSVIYNMGGLTPEERRDDAIMKRGELVKLLLDCAGYRSVANLSGIFTCDYADKDSVPAAELGYAALAQGLGVVTGSYNGSETVRRGSAAALLCRVMERDI